MGSTKAFRHRNRPALNSDGSKMLSCSYKHNHLAKTSSTTKPTISTNKPKPILTIQERLQHLSITYWRQPIDEALDLHLHGRLIFSDSSNSDLEGEEGGTGKISLVLDAESWTKWPLNYCKALMNLIPLVSAPRANDLLTKKMAGVKGGSDGVQPWVVREVVREVVKRGGKKGGVQGSKKRGAGGNENCQRGGRGYHGGSGQSGRGRVAK